MRLLSYFPYKLQVRKHFFSLNVLNLKRNIIERGWEEEWKVRRMEKERIANLLYTILGVIVGYFSLSLKDFLSLIALVFGIYLISLIPLKKKVKTEKALRWIFSNSFITYILAWLLVYLLLSNLV